MAYDFGGAEHGSMGVECGDVDNDGRLDFHVTSYQQELATLYRNVGDGIFEDATLATGAGAGTRRHVTWGNGLVDLDNDGDRDIFIGCGHLNDHVERYGRKSAAPALTLFGKLEDLDRVPGAFEVLDRALGGERAAVHWRNRGEDRDGHPYANEGVTWLRFDRGRIVFLSDFFKDTERF